MFKRLVLSRVHTDILANDQIIGEADFEEIGLGRQRYVRMILRVKGDPKVITPGEHFLHIHEIKNPEYPFRTAEGHFDLGPQEEDLDIEQPRENFPSIMIDNNGQGYLEAISTRATLLEGPLAALGEQGISLAINTPQITYYTGKH